MKMLKRTASWALLVATSALGLPACVAGADPNVNARGVPITCTGARDCANRGTSGGTVAQTNFQNCMRTGTYVPSLGRPLTHLERR